MHYFALLHRRTKMALLLMALFALALPRAHGSQSHRKKTASKFQMQIFRDRLYEVKKALGLPEDHPVSRGFRLRDATETSVAEHGEGPGCWSKLSGMLFEAVEPTLLEMAKWSGNGNPLEHGWVRVAYLANEGLNRGYERLEHSRREAGLRVPKPSRYEVNRLLKKLIESREISLKAPIQLASQISGLLTPVRRYNPLLLPLIEEDYLQPIFSQPNFSTLLLPVDVEVDRHLWFMKLIGVHPLGYAPGEGIDAQGFFGHDAEHAHQSMTNHGDQANRLEGFGRALQIELRMLRELDDRLRKPVDELLTHYLQETSHSAGRYDLSLGYWLGEELRMIRFWKAPFWGKKLDRDSFALYSQAAAAIDRMIEPLKSELPVLYHPNQQ